MKSTFVTWSLIGLPLLCCATNRPGLVSPLFAVMEIVPSTNDATIPWVTGPDEAWTTRAPLFDMADPANPDFRAKGWAAATENELWLRVDVYDPVHTNAFTGRKIRDGDFIRLAIDGNGDGPGKGPIDTDGLFGNDDAAICFALTAKGAEGWTFDTGIPAFADAYPVDLLDFTRDEAAKITRYTIRLPWNRIQVKPGVFPHFGLAVQVQNAGEPAQEPVRLSWGANPQEPKVSFFKANRPGLYKKVGWENPARELTAVAPAITTIWQTGDKAEFVAAISSKDPVVIRVSAGLTNEDYRVEGKADGSIRRYSLRYRPADGAANDPITVALFRGSALTPADGVTSQVVVADAVVQNGLVRLDELIARGGHPLFLRHVKSVKAMIQTEWARASLYKQENTALAVETLDHIRAILEGFQGASADWDSYVLAGRPLFMAYRSPRDGTLQWYALTLPKGWNPAPGLDPEKAYPMFFELHGRANPHYLFYPAAHLGNAPADPGLTSFAMIQRNGYHVYPFGRGNSGYRDIGETDVWEAYEDVQKTVKVDPDRRYLYGFSMGGGGTWSLGSRTPDRWAAIAILGAGVQVEPWGQAENASRLPIYMWGGEVDTLGYGSAIPPKERMAQFARDVEKAGGSVIVRSTPGIGHNYRLKEQEEALTWLQQFSRKRPAKFSFVADTDQHRGVWGITMTRKLSLSGLPRFTCVVEGQEVKITTEGTPRIDVWLDSNGLGMTGEVRVVVNGKNRYEGAVTPDMMRLDLSDVLGK